MEPRLDAIALLTCIVSISGKTFGWARDGDVTFSIATIKYFAGWADKISGQVLEVSTLASPVSLVIGS